MFDWFKEKEDWTKVDDKGYQYNKDGEARFVGEPKCEHVWENIAEYHLKCSKCGDEKTLDPPKILECEHSWKQESIDGNIYNKCIKCGFVEAIEKTHDCVFTEIKDDGYQYCKICNEAILPEKNVIMSGKKLRLTTTTKRNGEKNIIGHIFVHRCKKMCKNKKRTS